MKRWLGGLGDGTVSLLWAVVWLLSVGGLVLVAIVLAENGLA